MIIGFVTDTNLIKLNAKDLEKDVDFMKNTKFYIEYLEFLEKLDLDTQLVYIMPSIIMEELYTQKLEAFNQRYMSLKERYDEISYGLVGSLPRDNYIKELNKQKRMNRRKFCIVEPVLTASEFEKVMNDALKKEPPFNKEIDGKKSDAGFKDYMIWRTLVTNSFETLDELYFFTSDKVFKENKNKLEKQFNENHKKTKVNIIYIDPESSDKQKESLELIINRYNLPKTDVVKLYDYDMNLCSIKNIEIKLNKEIVFLTSYNRNVKIKDISFKDFEKEDIIISDVCKKDNDYCVSIDFSTLKYKTDKTIDDNDKVIVKGNLILYYQKNGLNYSLKHAELENVTTEMTIENFENIIRFCDFDYPKGMEYAIGEFRKYLIENKVSIYKKIINDNMIGFNYYFNDSNKNIIRKSTSSNFKNIKKNKKEKNKKDENKKKE